MFIWFRTYSPLENASLFIWRFTAKHLSIRSNHLYCKGKVIPQFTPSEHSAVLWNRAGCRQWQIVKAEKKRGVAYWLCQRMLERCKQHFFHTTPDGLFGVHLGQCPSLHIKHSFSASHFCCDDFIIFVHELKYLPVSYKQVCWLQPVA